MKHSSLLLESLQHVSVTSAPKYSSPLHSHLINAVVVSRFISPVLITGHSIIIISSWMIDESFSLRSTSPSSSSYSLYLVPIISSGFPHVFTLLSVVFCLCALIILTNTVCIGLATRKQNIHGIGRGRRSMQYLVHHVSSAVCNLSIGGGFFTVRMHRKSCPGWQHLFLLFSFPSHP